MNSASRALTRGVEKNMSVECIGEKYRCSICGNEAEITQAGGGTLVCCEKEMERIN